MNKKLRDIHKASIDILGNVGIKLHHPDILDLLNEHDINIKHQTARFTEDQVREWLNLAPSAFKLHSRNPNNDLVFGGPNHVYAPGYGCPDIIEAQGNRRKATIEDYINFTKLVQNSRFINLAGGIVVQPSDLKNEECKLAMLYAAMIYSDKCLLGIPGSAKEVEHLMNLTALLWEGSDQLKANPKILTLISTLSPLQIDHDALASMQICANHHQPMIISPGVIAGATGPISLAGTIAMGNAEALAAIVIAQILKPGIPVMYGLQATALDMQSGYSIIGTPAFSIIAKYCAELAGYYNLPSRGGGANTDAKIVSAQSGYESMLALLNARQQSMNLIIHSAGIMDSYLAMSYEKFMIDQEMISMIEYFLNDIEISDQSLSYDIIKQVGPGGQFLNHPDTFQKCRTEPWIPNLNLDRKNKDSKTAEVNFAEIEKKLNQEFTSYKKPNLTPIINKKLKDYLLECGLSPELLYRINSSS